MSAKTKVDGTRRDVIAPYIKVSDNWQIARSAWIKINDSWKSWFLQGGLNDSTFTEFDVWNGFNSNVSAIAIQSDGKIIIGGAFTSMNNIIRTRLARIGGEIAVTP